MRDIRINLRVTQEEAAMIARAAKLALRTRTDYARMATLETAKRLLQASSVTIEARQRRLMRVSAARPSPKPRKTAA